MKKPISTKSSWTPDVIKAYYEEIQRIGFEKFGLDIYPNQIELVTAEQMLDAYAFHGLPVMYPHWSFGRDYIFNSNAYKRGYQGLAYEMIINSNPAIAYLMEENTTMMQIAVMSHACLGHNHFFKNNLLMRTWTNADNIQEYAKFAKGFVEECEEKYGISEVERILTAAHSVKYQGIDRYKRPGKLSPAKEKERQQERMRNQQRQVNEVWRTLPADRGGWYEQDVQPKKIVTDPQENVMYFIEKNAPNLKPWQRECIRIVRKFAQYFYPNINTKVMNEGFATFIHYGIVQELHKEGLIDDGFMMEFLRDHTAIIHQPGIHDKHYSPNLNPYYLGYNIFREIKRVCEEPTKEDQEWFGDIAGSDWKTESLKAVRQFKDSSFLYQYLSPNLMRKMRMIEIQDIQGVDHYYIADIHNDEGYKNIRRTLSRQYEMDTMIPSMAVVDADLKGNRTLFLRSNVRNERSLDHTATINVLSALEYLWGYKVVLSVVNEDGKEQSKYST